ncbi:MAG: PilN domain-containing protein [Candidatus Omnitrophota bacterium]|nr:PilN domain-containing protein [Candidatus Omnitrophota bacterium]
MIEINLLPQELKAGTKPKSAQAPLASAEQIKKLLPIIAVVLGLLVCLQAALAVVNMLEASQLRVLNNKWGALEPQRKILEKFNQEYAILSGDAAVTGQLLKGRLLWAPKLYALSVNLPPGVWLNELSLNAASFRLQGSVVSPQGKEMSLINDFLDNLKKDTGFYGDFVKLELGSLQQRSAGTYKIEDFILSGTIKNEAGPGQK